MKYPKEFVGKLHNLFQMSSGDTKPLVFLRHLYNKTVVDCCQLKKFSYTAKHTLKR